MTTHNVMCVLLCVYRVLMRMLEVFSKFQNPKALYRHQDLHTLYMKVHMHEHIQYTVHLA